MACWLPVSRWWPLSVQACHVYLLLNKIISTTPQFYAVSVNSFRYTFYWTNQSSGAVWKSRWTSWAPVPNKPTVSDCGRKATLQPTEQMISTTPVLRRLCEQFSIYLLLTNYLDDTGFTPSLWTVFDTPFTEQIISTTSVLRRLCEQFWIYLLLNKLSRRHQFYAVCVNSFWYTFYWTNYLDDTNFTPSRWTVFELLSRLARAAKPPCSVPPLRL